ncbi:uroporphyrinogen-III C-methyltransferase [Motiliproteus coralliicola]|uniref:Uroporphyrinogen-III C-methyltransferase n=1 Tax=Motiliproteus coralliicola TaxID=2283196 RepID=A0A369WF29_9GAMM|nr:siroheme synthase CysG [Motiliproteus coralliicola]RDE19769.1 uroporphyrinogen-III C-methyltransferase [Motiliproteus coralliicola]
METFPLFLRSQQARALIVGGGSQATAKARLLNQAKFTITIAAQAPCDELCQLIEEAGLNHQSQGYFPELLKQHDLVVIADIATDEAAQIAEQARALNLPTNVVDQPSLCSFFFSAVVDRSPITVAIGSQGNSPILAHYVRRRIETSLPGSLDRLAELMARHRDQVKQIVPSAAERLQFWEALLDADLPEQIRAGDTQADQLVKQALEDYAAKKPTSGTVYLVGSGPGDPDLLTVKALRIIQQADVVVYDRLVSDEIMKLTRRDAEMINVGKTMGNHTLPQEQINQLLVKLSRQGKRVVRLKGGDPFIFGRGGEEVEELLQEGVRFQVIPGITAASGSSTYCGIPLTHRDHAQSVTFVTGHLKTDQLNLEWGSLAQPHQTLVFYMGLTALPIIAKQLQAHGMPSDTPVALVYKATRPEQRLLVGQLDNIAQLKDEHQFKSPSLIIVGSVVSLADKIGSASQI